MAAYPKDGAYAYFSAARNTCFTKLGVVWWNLQKLSIYDTGIAKDNYDKRTGNIGPCGENADVCGAFDAQWIFCKPKKERRVQCPIS